MSDAVTTGDEIFTTGHSTHALPALLELLARHQISAVADVRSDPYSRRNPQLNRETLERACAIQAARITRAGRNRPDT